MENETIIKEAEEEKKEEEAKEEKIEEEKEEVKEKEKKVEKVDLSKLGLTDLQLRIATVILENPTLSLSEIAKRCNCSVTLASKVKKKLEQYLAKPEITVEKGEEKPSVIEEEREEVKEFKPYRPPSLTICKFIFSAPHKIIASLLKAEVLQLTKDEEEMLGKALYEYFVEKRIEFTPELDLALSIILVESQVASRYLHYRKMKEESAILIREEKKEEKKEYGKIPVKPETHEEILKFKEEVKGVKT